MSFFKKLFGLGSRDGGRDSGGAPVAGTAQTHEGFTITATPFEANGRWQLCGVIAKEIDGETKEQRFIRADSFATREDAAEMTFFKARQMIDQMGEDVLKAG